MNTPAHLPRRETKETYNMNAETNVTMRHVGENLLELRISFDPLDDAFRVLGAPNCPLPEMSTDTFAEMGCALEELRRTSGRAQAHADLIDAGVVALQMREFSDKLDMRLWATFVSGYDHSPLGRVTGAMPDLPTASREDRRAFLMLAESVGPYLTSCIKPTVAAAQNGRAPLRSSLERALARWRALLASGGTELVPTGSPQALREELAVLFERSIHGAVAQYAEMLASEVAPLARPDEHPGLCYIHEGDTNYGRLVATHTDDFGGTERIHTLGREEVARLQDDLRALSEASRSQSSTIADLLELGGDEPRYGALTEVVEHICAVAREAPRNFSPVVHLEGVDELLVKEIPEHLSASSPTAYYLPADGGGRPGTIMINPVRLVGKPRGSALAMIYHEGIPGHHAQFEIARKATLPRFRRSAWFNAFIEGWGLYCEELSEELGLYNTRSARLGKLSLELFRATRLVVDTGLHCHGWSMEQATRYLTENAGLSTEAAKGEVARYVEYPAQALSYALGKIRILETRSTARRRWGATFTLRRFHDALLRHGSVPISAIVALLAEADPSASAPDEAARIHHLSRA